MPSICLVLMHVFFFIMVFSAHFAAGAPQIDPPSQTVNVNDPSYIRCWVPENPHAELIWRKKHGHLSTDASQVEGILTIPQTQESDTGEYICSTRGTDGSAIDSPPARIDINKRMYDFYAIFCKLQATFLTIASHFF